MKKALVGFLVAALASTALAGISSYVVMNNPNDGNQPTDFDYYTFDLHVTLSNGDDWTSTSLDAAITSGDAQFNPRRVNLKPATPPGDGPPAKWADRWGNQASTGNDWPNTFDNSNSSYATAGTISSSATSLSITWFDTGDDSGLFTDFVNFRMTLSQNKGMNPLTLQVTNQLVGSASGKYSSKQGGGSLFPYSFNIYRTPEPTTLALLALGGLAGLIRRR